MPAIATLADEFDGRAKVVKLDTDTLMFPKKKLRQRFNITELPLILIFKDGQEVARLTGAEETGKAAVRAALLAALGEDT